MTSSQDARAQAEQQWCTTIATSITDELLRVHLIPEDQANAARATIAQNLSVQLTCGVRPPNADLSMFGSPIMR
jgi:hypothetical protein